MNSAATGKEAKEAILDELSLRSDAAAIPYLDTYLAGESTDIGLFIKTLGALVATGREEAARVIIKHTKNKSPDMVIQMIYALEQLPCPDSYGFLITMAHGYPDNKVREAAQNVLQTHARFAPTPGEN